MLKVLIRWIVIYPLDSTVQPLNEWGLNDKWDQYEQTVWPVFLCIRYATIYNVNNVDLSLSYSFWHTVNSILLVPSKKVFFKSLFHVGVQFSLKFLAAIPKVSVKGWLAFDRSQYSFAPHDLCSALPYGVVDPCWFYDKSCCIECIAVKPRGVILCIGERSTELCINFQTWMAFGTIHRPLFTESKNVDFPNNASLSTNYNGAFCKVGQH